MSTETDSTPATVFQIRS